MVEYNYLPGSGVKTSNKQKPVNEGRRELLEKVQQHITTQQWRLEEDRINKIIYVRINNIVNH